LNELIYKKSKRKMNPIIEEKEIPVKIVIVGAKSIGKTNLSYKFMKKNFVEEYNESKFINYDSKKINCLNKNLRLDIWDTVGKIINKFMSARLYGDANICLILFDLTNLDSLNDVDYYYNEIKIHNYKNCCIILVGNKCDDIENRKIFKKDIKQLKEKYKIPYFEISCKNGRNIKELEYFICRSYIQNTINDDIEDNQYDIQYNQNFKIKKPSNRVKNICFIF
jgi:small GTP-binding protein